MVWEDARVLTGNDPKACRCLVCIQEVHRRDGLNCQVVVQYVVFLHPILDEERVAHDVVDDVAGKTKEVDTVHRCSTVPTVVYRDIALKGFAEVANHVPDQNLREIISLGGGEGHSA